MNQNENKPMREQGTLETWCDIDKLNAAAKTHAEHPIKNKAQMLSDTVEMHEHYLAKAFEAGAEWAMENCGRKQIETAEENATWAHDQLQSTQEELIYYKDRCKKQGEQLKQVTEERDKAVELLDRVQETIEQFSEILDSDPVCSDIAVFLKYVKPAKEGGE